MRLEGLGSTHVGVDAGTKRKTWTSGRKLPPVESVHHCRPPCSDPSSRKRIAGTCSNQLDCRGQLPGISTPKNGAIHIKQKLLKNPTTSPYFCSHFSFVWEQNIQLSTSFHVKPDHFSEKVKATLGHFARRTRSERSVIPSNSSDTADNNGRFNSGFTFQQNVNYVLQQTTVYHKKLICYSILTTAA